MIQSLRRELSGNLLTPWICLFLILSCFPIQTGGTNALSRVAAMRSVVVGEGFRIDKIKSWTLDWSLSPDGHYYSNKAPGSILIGLPVFYVLDHAFSFPSPPTSIELLLLSFFTQLLPFALLVLLIGKALRESGVSASANLFFGLAALFGNTASIYMSSYFGHGIAANLVLGAFYLWVMKGKLALPGFLLCLAAVSDLSVFVLLPFFLIGVYWRERRAAELLPAIAGMLPALAIFLFYNHMAFGSPFALPISFSNPEVIDKIEGHQFLFGTFHAVAALFELLFGTARGILVTQPWIFIALGAAFYPRTAALRGSGIFIGAGFLALLYLMANTASWHGGDSAGPRYLSSVFPSLALLLALQWKVCSTPLKQMAIVGLAISLVFRFLAWPFSNTPPFDNLWLHFLGQVFTWGPALFMFATGLALIAVTVVWHFRNKKTQGS